MGLQCSRQPLAWRCFSSPQSLQRSNVTDAVSCVVEATALRPSRNATPASRRSKGTNTTWGLQNRLSRIIRPTDGHTVMLAADHGYFLGPTHKLEIPRKTLEPLLPYADAVMVTRGVVRTSIDPGANVPIVLRVSGGASVLNEDLSNEKITTSMKEAIRLT